MAITEHRSPSLRETFSISFPLMLSSLSVYIMYAVDRFILACFSLDALNTAAPAASLSWAFWAGICVMAGMSEVFVAQYRVQHPALVGKAIWHSIWLTVGAAILIFPTAFFVASRIYVQDSLQYDCFFWSMSFGILDPIIFALTTFFVSQGKTKFILAITVAKMIWQSALNYALIFGVSPWIPSLGAKGAPIGTGISTLILLAILFYCFLKRENRLEFGTFNWRIHLGTLLKTAKLAAPPSILYNIEMWGWGLFDTMMAASSSVHMTITGLCESLIYLFLFVADGLYWGILLQANNSIAQGRPQHLRRIFTSGCIILATFLVVQLAVLYISPYIYLSIASSPGEELTAILPSFRICLFLVLVYLFFQGIQYLLSAFLCAMGETMPMMITGSIGLFACLVVPTYFLVVKQGFAVEWAWGIVLFYTIICCVFYGWLISVRSRKQRRPLWKSLSLDLQPSMQVVDKAG